DSGSFLGYIRIYAFVRFSPPYRHREIYFPELNLRKTMPLCEYGPRQDNKKKVTACGRGICQNYGISPGLYWNPTYSCFIFGKVDLVPTVEEYITFLVAQRSRSTSLVAQRPDFLKKANEHNWDDLRDLILVHPDTREKFNIFALSIDGLVIFPKALGYIEDTVIDLFDRLDKRSLLS
ncbi:hypothetical protein Gohar_025163, partial [Gossypium harknessii]|nr:hypothetical protein [Gossypium harknessii]